MGRLWEILQRHIDAAPYPPSERQVAAKLGVSPTTLANWRDPKKLPSRENLQAVADLVGVRYSVVLDAALYDTGYHEGSVIPMPEHDDEEDPGLGSPARELWLAERALHDAKAAIKSGAMRDSPELLARLRRDVEDERAALAVSPNERA